MDVQPPQRPPSPLEEGRVAHIRLDPTTLRHLLCLPDGMRVERIFTEQDPMSVKIVVSSPDLEPQPEGAYSPPLKGSWSLLVHLVRGEDENGKDDRVWYRWGWLEGSP